MKFLVDMPLSRSLAQWLAARGHDAKHASDLGLDRAPDAEILARAKQEMRTIVTADLDYPRLLALAQSREPSLILFRDGNWSEAEVVARMTDVLEGLSEEDIVRSIIVIEKDRVRRRRLPLGP
jgi:predicted nuclease of predicted toxin-antitoxin system